METTREVAAKVVEEWLPALQQKQPNYLHPLIDAIDSALRDHEVSVREECAKVADRLAEEMRAINQRTQYAEGKLTAAKMMADEIRSLTIRNSDSKGEAVKDER